MLGTDSLLVTFENKSDYKIDSAYLLFQNQGLFVHHFDTIRIASVSPKGKTELIPPLHKLGVSRSIKVIAIFSKELDFKYDACLVNGDDAEDHYEYHYK